MKQALAARPEVAETSLALDVNKLNTRLARDAAKPRVDAFANLTAAGLAGTACPVSPLLSSFFPGAVGCPAAIFDGAYGQSLSNILRGNFPSVQVGRPVVAAHAQSDGAGAGRHRRCRGTPLAYRAEPDRHGRGGRRAQRAAGRASRAARGSMRRRWRAGRPMSSTLASSASFRPARRPCSWCCSARPT